MSSYTRSPIANSNRKKYIMSEGKRTFDKQVKQNLRAKIQKIMDDFGRQVGTNFHVGIVTGSHGNRAHFKIDAHVPRNTSREMLMGTRKAKSKLDGAAHLGAGVDRLTA